MLWTGRIISGLLVVLLLMDASIKLLRIPAAVEGTAKLGYPTDSIVPIGIALLIGVILYAIPRSAVLGAILLTGYLGGAAATQFRVESPWFCFPVVLGMLVWLGLYLRDGRLRQILPLSK